MYFNRFTPRNVFLFLKRKPQNVINFNCFAEYMLKYFYFADLTANSTL